MVHINLLPFSKRATFQIIYMTHLIIHELYGLQEAWWPNPSPAPPLSHILHRRYRQPPPLMTPIISPRNTSQRYLIMSTSPASLNKGHLLSEQLIAILNLQSPTFIEN